MSQVITDGTPTQSSKKSAVSISNDFHLNTLMERLKEKDTATYQHSIRVGLYALQLGKELKLSFDECLNLYFGGLLHDIGKLNISNDILLKPTSLTDGEYRVIKQHPEMGYSLLKDTGLLEEIKGLKDMVLHHHERLSGVGYPHGLIGDEVSTYARIMGIADSFDAMMENRVYQHSLGLDTAIQELMDGKYRLYDADMVDAFVRIIER